MGRHSHCYHAGVCLMREPVMSELILHHYDLSPFAEKIRLVCGFKQLAWRSVVIPAVMPKPDYTALTGGYRRTPSLQIGADIYCDTRLIAEELEARHPSPTLFPPHQRGLMQVITRWAEESFFWPCARTVVGANAEHLPETFHADRAAMRGHAAPSLARTRAAGQEAAQQLQPQMRWVEDLLGRGTPYLLGAMPSLADFALYHCLWFLEQMPQRLLEQFTCDVQVLDWMARLAAIGHGKRTELTPADALAIARSSSPQALPARGLGELVPGLPVHVEPEERTSAPVQGTLVCIDANRVVLRREDPQAGLVQVHFPRLGYRVAPLPPT
ncbi:MAG: hypothetical protein RL434_1138 [Pseudomonadota bacterium]